ncbi:DUF3090 family protein [Egibacter rhizosphaerae]|uniref:DUF3090 family protein n=1 Tax=Egibacter rhizosphaerae TaxID=1670831 RepID=A0A411YIS9_9ACTN|nr:DUF3090 family protein [Egibacter rhizosphaerae]QBI21133.1 DUF3090 family protein [Egibacter rhizosphaerae]
MGESVEFESVEFITAGAVGEPGERAFYVQAEGEGQRVALLAEKTQIRSLAQLAQELLGRAGITVTPDDLDEASQRLREPVEPWWRAGSMSLGMDDEAERFVLEVEELPEELDPAEEPGEARFWMTREQLTALAAYAAYAVEAGARETCRLCSRPIDPVEGHVCPAQNGHGPLTT